MKKTYNRDIQVEILDPYVMPGQQFSIVLINGIERALSFRYCIVCARTRAVIVQSGETEEMYWETCVPRAGNYYVSVEALFEDGSKVEVAEPLQVSHVGN
ncbi:MAG: hypothetical protein MUC35_00380 [Candidatus Margulisbacteria bacterium]|jgi:hypothetical protein|nr:hypothetical protein [Candidatus Margulisiibacteriota bacterium]